MILSHGFTLSTDGMGSFSSVDNRSACARTLLRPNNSSLVVVGGKVPAPLSALIENDIVRIQLSSWVSIPFQMSAKKTSEPLNHNSGDASIRLAKLAWDLAAKRAKRERYRPGWQP